MTADRIVDRLDALREAVLTGRIGDLDTISAGLETDLRDLGRFSPDEAERIGHSAAAAARGVAAALQGVRSARRRIGELVAAERPQTYGDDGQMRTLAGQGPGRRV